MRTIREWLHKIDNLPGYNKRRVYYHIKAEMNGDPDFYTKFWDTEVSDTVWKALLREALEQ